MTRTLLDDMTAVSCHVIVDTRDRQSPCRRSHRRVVASLSLLRSARSIAGSEIILKNEDRDWPPGQRVVVGCGFAERAWYVGRYGTVRYAGSCAFGYISL